MKLKQKVDWESLYKYGERKFYKEKEVIFKQGTFGEGFYYIYDGFIKVITYTTKGNERLLNIAFPGQTLGLQALDQNSYATTAIAAKDSVLYFYSTEQITNLIYHHPELLNLITDTIHQNNSILIQSVHLDTMSSIERISFFLLTYYEEFEKNKLPITIHRIIKYTGLTRVTVQGILKEWEEKGIILLKNRELMIKNPMILKVYFEESIRHYQGLEDKEAEGNDI